MEKTGHRTALEGVPEEGVAGRIRPAAGVGQSAPRFTVVIPLVQHRDLAAQCLNAWAEGQDFPRGRYEVVLVSDGSEPALERTLQSLLGPHDRLLRERGVNRTRLYDLGARAARGEFVFLTEAHCIPQADCLTELDRFLEESSYDGACCRSIGVARRFQDCQDQATFEEGFELFRREGDWRKVNVHGFALRRSTYVEAGGLAHRYGGFAEMMLAATLRDRGVRLGYAAGAAVRHHYRSTAAEVEQLIDFFVHGESLYRTEHPGPDPIGFTFVPYDLAELPDPKADLWGSLAIALGRDLATRGLWRWDWSTRRAFVEALGQAVDPALLLRRWPLIRATALKWLARCRSWGIGQGPRRARAYRSWLDLASRASRTAFLVRQPPRLLAPPVPAVARRLITELPEDHWVGFHPIETYQGRPFRWTGRAALIRLAPRPGIAVVRLETNGLRTEPPHELNLRVFLNGRRVPHADVAVEGAGVRIRVADADRRTGLRAIALACTPLRPWESGVPDRRELGLSIFAIDFEPHAS